MSRKTQFAAVVAFTACCAALEAQVVSPVQSAARPFGLDIVDTVTLSGSDARASEFNANHLPYFQQQIDSHLSERNQLQNPQSMMLDPAAISLATDYNARVYFVGEGAGYANTLGFNTIQNGVANGVDQLIFPNVSSNNSYLDPADPAATRTSRAPLLAGDFVDLGTIAGGNILDFFLIANGANGGQHKYTGDAARNPDELQHVVAFAEPGTPYLMIGFEDLYNGGDLDYNDALFVVDIGTANVQQLTGGPEPSTFVLCGFLGAGALVVHRRRRRTQSPESPVE